MISATTEASTATRKAMLRREMRTRRAALTPMQRADFSHRIAANLAALYAQIGQPQRVAIYLAAPQEASIDAFAPSLLDNGAHLFAPRKDGFVPLPNLQDVTLGRFGIREPQSSKTAANLDCVLLPGLAFDQNGGRLGQGGGWYDRVLPTLKPDVWRIGVCFECQFVESVPREEHDQGVHFLVTESQTHAFSNP